MRERHRLRRFLSAGQRTGWFCIRGKLRRCRLAGVISAAAFGEFGGVGGELGHDGVHGGKAVDQATVYGLLANEHAPVCHMLQHCGGGGAALAGYCVHKHAVQVVNLPLHVGAALGGEGGGCAVDALVFACGDFGGGGCVARVVVMACHNANGAHLHRGAGNVHGVGGTAYPIRGAGQHGVTHCDDGFDF